MKQGLRQESVRVLHSASSVQELVTGSCEHCKDYLTRSENCLTR